ASFTTPAGWTVTAPRVGGTGGVTAHNATLEAGATAHFSLVVRVNANVHTGTKITNRATATGAGFDLTDFPLGDQSTTVTHSVLAVRKKHHKHHIIHHGKPHFPLVFPFGRRQR